MNFNPFSIPAAFNEADTTPDKWNVSSEALHPPEQTDRQGKIFLRFNMMYRTPWETLQKQNNCFCFSAKYNFLVWKSWAGENRKILKCTELVSKSNLIHLRLKSHFNDILILDLKSNFYYGKSQISLWRSKVRFRRTVDKNEANANFKANYLILSWTW